MDDATRELNEYLKNNPELKVVMGDINEALTLKGVDIIEPPKPDIHMLTYNIEPEIPFRSKTERRAWNETDLWFPHPIAIKLYEPYVFTLSHSPQKITYQPDFVFIDTNGVKHIIEVKGSWKAYLSGRSSKKSLAVAADKYYFEGIWYALTVDKKKWKLVEIKPRNHV